MNSNSNDVSFASLQNAKGSTSGISSLTCLVSDVRMIIRAAVIALIRFDYPAAFAPKIAADFKSFP